MLINVPIESLEERYSKQWNEWFPAEFERLGISAVTVNPYASSPPWPMHIENGQFLDVVKTNIYKSSQLTSLCIMILDGTIRDGDTIFFHDLWFPGLEMLFYIRDGMGLKFKIAGMLHAGTYDPYDFLAQRKMERWAKGLEVSWFNEVDHLFVATQFHAHLLAETGRIGKRQSTKVHVVRFPLMWENTFMGVEKDNLVVFPHRLAPEKAPEAFDHLAAVLGPEFPDWQFVKTKYYCTSKDDYWTTLARAKVAISCAHQETWGIAQQEAVLSDCIPLVPDRLSYHEMYDYNYTYLSFEELVSKTRHFMLHHDEAVNSATFLNQKSRFVQDGKASIETILHILGLV